MNERVGKYLHSREVFRAKAVEQFFEHNAEMEALVLSVGECVASSTLFLSGMNMRQIDHGLYIGDLVVSFCRSHFTAVDLIATSELGEGCLLIRKQLELMSRLHEITQGLPEKMWHGRTPNLKHLRSSLNKMYSKYSAISHSGNKQIMELLGRSEREEGTYTVLYPEFQENSYVAMQHLFINALEFWCWFQDFKVKNFPGSEPTDPECFYKSMSLMQKIFDDSVT